MNPEEQASGKLNIKKEIFEWVKIFAIAAVIALFLNSCIIANSRVPSGSMENTIMTGDRLVGFRLAYKLGNVPQRGDIVVFDHKAEPGKDKTRLLKRIIGLPGETVNIKGNRVYIDDSVIPLEEPYLADEMETEDITFEIPEGSYLMLGDNRNYSLDARSWSDPYVPEEEIVAKAVLRYFPRISVIK